jgi:hypothetical protein
MKYLIATLLPIFMISSIIFHLWTTYYAFSVGGFWSGILSFILPFLSEVYWCIKMWGKDSTYTTIACIHILGAIVFSLFGGSK